MNDRLVALVDMDCFYCQVETRLNPSLKGKPMAVVQYNQWKGGGIIAVNYEARDRGVTRHMRGQEAKKHCPEIQLVSVPSVRGKADLTKYRDAGREVINVICEFSECVQRASVDEAYIDLTEAVEKQLANKTKVSSAQLENTFVVGYSPQDSNDEVERERGVEAWLQDVYSSKIHDPGLHRLATATALVEQMRAAVFDKTGFRCSAGIAHNKILAKLVCGLHKPNRQSVLPMSSVVELYRTLPVKKVRNLGGKFGDDVVEKLGITHMSELLNFTEKQLQAKYDEKTGTWLYNIARGIDLDPVTPRLISKSIGCCKKFPGKTALSTKQLVTHWLSELAAEVAERLDEDISMNKRKSQLLTIHFSLEIDGKDVSMSRSIPLPGYEAERIAEAAFNVLSKHKSSHQSDEVWHPPLKYMGLSAGKFTEYSGNTSGSIDKFFKSKAVASTSKSDNNGSSDINPLETVETKSKELSEVNDKLDEKNPSLNSKATVKGTGRVSFFEQYFKNQPNKILTNVTLKQTKVQEDIMNNEKLHQQLTDKNNDQANLSTPKEDDCFIVNADDYGEANPLDKHSLRNGITEENTENDNDDSWISLSEIFPDSENIDDNVIGILPSPLQRKILKMKNSKKSKEKEYTNDNLQVSTDSDCAPTTVETVADIHTVPGIHHVVSSSSKYVLQRRASSEEDVIEAETLFNTSLDMFESESNQRSEEIKCKSDLCEKCLYCKESIAKYELQEHLDHHMAMELHKKLNKHEQHNRPTIHNQTRTTKTVTVLSDKKKRGRPSKKEVDVTSKKSRTIMSFFTKS